MSGDNGGVIGAVSPVVTRTAASGVWRPSTVARRKSLYWPTVGTDPYFANVTNLYHVELGETYNARGPIRNWGSLGTSGDLIATDFVGTPSLPVIVTDRFKFGTSAWALGRGTTEAGAVLKTGLVIPMSTGDFTFEGWFYLPDHAKSKVLFETRGWSGGGTGWVFYVDTNKSLCCYIDSVGLVITSAANVSVDGQWNHYAISRVSGYIRLFCNGVQAGSHSDGGRNYGTRNLVVGQDFQGNDLGSTWGDEMRVTIGVGRYTADFTPPTEPFPDK